MIIKLSSIKRKNIHSIIHYSKIGVINTIFVCILAELAENDSKIHLVPSCRDFVPNLGWHDTQGLVGSLGQNPTFDALKPRRSKP